MSIFCIRGSFLLCKHTFTNCKYNDNRTFPHSRKLPPHRHKNHLLEMMPNKRCLVQVIALNSAHLIKSPFLVLRWPGKTFDPTWYIKNVFHTMRRHLFLRRICEAIWNTMNATRLKKTGSILPENFIVINTSIITGNSLGSVCITRIMKSVW